MSIKILSKLIQSLNQLLDSEINQSEMDQKEQKGFWYAGGLKDRFTTRKKKYSKWGRRSETKIIAVKIKILIFKKCFKFQVEIKGTGTTVTYVVAHNQYLSMLSNKLPPEVRDDSIMRRKKIFY